MWVDRYKFAGSFFPVFPSSSLEWSIFPCWKDPTGMLPILMEEYCLLKNTDWLLYNLVCVKDETKLWEHTQSLPHFSVSILSWRNLAVFSINLDCGNISDSISCSIPDKGFAEACSSVDLGHSSGGKVLKTSLIALSEDQVSILVSDPESLEGRGKVYSDIIVWTLGISSGCIVWGFCTACGLYLLLWYLP